MRTLQKPVKILAAALCACLLTTFLLSGCISSPSQPPSPSADPSPLTAEQVAGMRGEYPICSGGSTQAATLPRKLEYYLGDEYESIYAQVIGKETTQRLEIQDDTVEGASAELYGATVCDYFMIPIRILDDPGGKYSQGEELILYGNMDFRAGMPALEEGSSFVALVREIGPGIHQNTSDKTLVSTSEQGFYYITDDGHAIAAYEEPEYFQQNGVGLATLLENYEKIYAEMTAEQTDQ